MPSEREILDRHRQALGEARRACQQLGKNADPEYLAPRGRWYSELRQSLMLLEGSSRQLAHWRADARWLKLGILYGKTVRDAQAKFVGQKWAWFGRLTELFVIGERRIEELQAKTGRIGPILPARPSDFLVLPDHKPTLTPPRMIQ